MGEQDHRLVVLFGGFMRLAMGASRATGFRAGAERLVHDLLDGAGASSTLGAAAETSVDLPRRARRHLREAHGVAYVVVGEYVAGTNDHVMQSARRTSCPLDK